jgi:thioesterase domain-containing protein
MKGENRLLQPTVERLSAAFIEEMRQVQPEGPYDLAGGCVGGIIAFEMARQLAAAGHDLSRVVLIDTGYPTSYLYLRQHVRRTCAQLRFHLQRLLMHRNGQLGRRGQMIYDRISGWISFAERDAHPGHHPGIFVFAATMFRYRVKPYSGRLHLILSKEFAASAPEKAWGRWAAGGTSVTVVPGDHWTYIRDHFEETGAVFRQALEEPN